MPRRGRLGRAELERLTEIGGEQRAHEARCESDRMALAHRHLEECSRSRLRRRATSVLHRTDAPLDPAARRFFSEIARTGQPIVYSVADDEGMVCVSSIGLALLGQPDVLLYWPEAMEDRAIGVATDLINDCCQGKRGKLVDKRKVYAQRFELAYEMRAVPDHDGEPLAGKAGGAAYAVPGVPQELGVFLVADLREGVLLDGLKNGLAIYRDKDGKSTFTGYVRLPTPSNSWYSWGINHCVARLDDVDGDLEGPCTIVTPAEFMLAMRDYD